jgi:protein required for attachment to host cells
MLLPHGTVLAIVDGKNFELWRNTGSGAEPKLSSLDAPDLEATNFSAGNRLNDGPNRHQARTGDGSNDTLDESAHVVAVTDWLNQEVLAHRIDQLIVVADPRSLGEMRRHYHKQLKDVLVADVSKHLSGRPAQDIVQSLHS